MHQACLMGGGGAWLDGKLWITATFSTAPEKYSLTDSRGKGIAGIYVKIIYRIGARSLQDDNTLAWDAY
jgi:hypothetical protein